MEFIKFLKYLNKYNQIGGKDDDKYTKKINKIKTKLDDKGYYFWFDINGKLLAKDVKKEKAKLKFLAKTSDTNLNDNKYIVIGINIDKNAVMNKETGGLELIISKERIKKRSNGLGTELLDEKNNMMRLYYRFDELEYFKFTDLKKIANILTNDKMKISSLKYYHYADIKKLIDQ